jgi:hypothetical protein
MTTTQRTEYYQAHFTGNPVAKCLVCDKTWVGWDSEDLDDNGDIYCCQDLD